MFSVGADGERQQLRAAGTRECSLCIPLLLAKLLSGCLLCSQHAFSGMVAAAATTETDGRRGARG